jgi:hypothetical protein
MMEPSPHQLARIIALRQSSGSDAKALLALRGEVMPVPKPVTRKMKQKVAVNHRTKHKALLKTLENKNRLHSKNQEEEVRHEREKMMRLRLKCVGNVESKLFSLRNLHLDSRKKDMGTQEDKSTATGTTTTLEGTSTSSRNSLLSSVLKSTNAHEQERPNNPFSRPMAPIITDCKDKNKSNKIMVKHDSFGRVPRYILERRIQIAEEEQGKQRQHNEKLLEKENERGNVYHGGESSALLSEMNRVPVMRGAERTKLLRELSENKDTIKKELEKLPFGLQSEGSIRKRDRLNDSIKDIENAKKIIMSTPQWGRRRH